MALTNATLVSNGTLNVTAGEGAVTVSYAPSGQDIPNGLQIIDTSSTDPRTRKTISVKARMSSYNSITKEYVKDKREITLTHPKLLADGSTAFRIVRISYEEHPESTADERKELLDLAAQTMFDTDFAQFLATGARS